MVKKLQPFFMVVSVLVLVILVGGGVVGCEYGGCCALHIGDGCGLVVLDVGMVDVAWWWWCWAKWW